ncbi:MAG: alpha-mannosidase [Candidatus Xenobia bacterium]
MHHQHRWTAEKIDRRLKLVEGLVYRRSTPLKPFRLKTLESPLEAPPLGDEARGWPEVAPLSYWGRWRLDFLLRTQLKIPADWSGPLALFLPLGEAGDFSHPEAAVYLDGVLYAACDRHHQEIRLPGTLQDGRSHRLELHGWTGMGGNHLGDPGRKLLMKPCLLVEPDLPTRELLALARVAHGIATHLDEHDPVRGKLLDALDRAFLVLDTREPHGERFYASVPEALKLLRQAVEQSGPPLPVQLFASGHAHIDVAWLWPLSQTRRKAERSFTTVLRLMEEFPEYHYTQSQPQLYDYVRQDHPELFAAIAQRVAEGRWECTGGMWVEADANLSGSESLARQLLLGRRFFRKHFGPEAETPVLFLPDVFGYSAALPQLIREAGLKYFFTIKIGWNQYNRLPYDSFWWQGLDGTRVLTHFSTSPELGGRYASTYNSQAVPEQVLGCWRTLKQKELHDNVLMLYGHGDGGGGPTRQMLENLREMRSFPATPQVRQASVGAFFERLEEQSQRLPVWDGELYLELHRGTYTSQARNKRANRKSEMLLHDAEFLASWAWLVDPAGGYPSGGLSRAWELVCLNQFHDILPGSSIAEVYLDSQAQYREVEQLAQHAWKSAFERLSAELGGAVVVVNPTAFERNDPVFVESPVIKLEGVPMQPTEGGAWISVKQEPYSLKPLAAGTPAPLTEEPARAGEGFLENAFLRVELDEAGDVVRVYHKPARREVLSGKAELLLFEDRPLNWNAWDVDIYYDERSWTAEPASSIQVVEEGPLVATLEVRRKLFSSTLVQLISLGHSSERLDFDCRVDWHERHVLLKAAFPLAIHQSQACFEVQWGHVYRPTHRNTSWDWARFETCAHRWVDLSEGDYGVSLLNDCKYGHDVQGSVVRLSLLRSPSEPDPEADKGEHRFVYSLLPHFGPLGVKTIKHAYQLNDPSRAMRGSGGPARGRRPLVRTSRLEVVVETIKRAEEGDALIVRCYECQRTRGQVALSFDFEVGSAFRVNLLEEEPRELKVEGHKVYYDFRPFEIFTLKIVPK